MSASTRWIVLIGAATLTLVLASVAVAQFVDREVEYEIGTPEGAVQAYLRAVTERDATTAHSFYSAELRDSCDITHLRDSLRWESDNFRATLSDVVSQGDTTEVRVSIVQTYGSGPFGRSESVFEQTFVLADIEGDWRFVEVPWPSWCPEPATPARGSLISPESAPWS